MEVLAHDENSLINIDICLNVIRDTAGDISYLQLIFKQQDGINFNGLNFESIFISIF